MNEEDEIDNDINNDDNIKSSVKSIEEISQTFSASNVISN